LLRFAQFFLFCSRFCCGFCALLPCCLLI
jgi:hypothetical protein